MDERQLHVLQHSLGVDKYGRGKQYRNHFCAGGDDLVTCEELTEAGLMVRREGSALSGGYPVFFVTDAGRAAVAEHSPKPPKLSRGKERYLRYLHSDSDLSFIDWVRRYG